MKIMWSNETLVRLRYIKRFIAKDNPGRAAQFIQKIIDRTEVLISNPQIGRVVPEIARNDIRELFKNYRIVYRIKKQHIEILTVFEGHMLLKVDEFDD